MHRFSREQNIWLFCEVFIAPLSAAAGMILVTLGVVVAGMGNLANFFGFAAWAGYLLLFIGWWVLLIHAALRWKDFKVQQEIRRGDNEH